MGVSSTSGWRVGLQYDFIDQAALLYQSSLTSPGAVAATNASTGGAQEIEGRTVNRYITLGLDYTFTPDWNVKLLAPFIDRSHTTYGGATSIDPSQLSSASVDSWGDMKFIGTYQGLLPTHNLGIQVGVKIPTGAYGGPNAAGTGTVGNNPVTFGPGGNSGSQYLDTSLQAGTGSTDIILGGFYFQPVSQNFDGFVTAQYQFSVAQELNQPGEDYRPGNSENLSFGVRYEANPKFVPQLQINITNRANDTGTLADVPDTAGSVAYLSPGITAVIFTNTVVYSFVQIPFYENLSGYQLFPRYTVSVGISQPF